MYIYISGKWIFNQCHSYFPFFSLEEIGLVTSPTDYRIESPSEPTSELGNNEDFLSTAEPSNLLPSLYAAQNQLQLQKSNSTSVLRYLSIS